MKDAEMLLPQLVTEVAEKAFLDLQSHPTGYLEWSLRQKLYRAFGSYGERRVQLARGWLAILAAQKVLPIFTSLMPYYSLPIHLISVAIDELSPYKDEIDVFVVTYDHAKRVHDLLQLSYHTLGNEVLEDYHGRFFRNADMAATAARKALQEARGWEDPFERIEHFYKGTGENEGFMSFSTQSKFSDWEPIEQYSEENWAYLAAVGDTAGAAAIAYASSPDSRVCDTNKSKEFWFWWLREALPEAWKLASWDWISK